MLRRQVKQSGDSSQPGAPRVIVVDDDPDAGRLLGALLRREGYEVAEIGDHQVVLVTLQNEPSPIAGVVVSCTAGGSAACLKLLDAVRHTPDRQVSDMALLLVLDDDQQHRFAWESGADAILTRPYHERELVDAVESMIGLGEEARVARRDHEIARLSETGDSSRTEASTAPTTASLFD
ncbi:MAG: hypothetical protein R2698_03500 [Microthrixaceae bacterium]